MYSTTQGFNVAQIGLYISIIIRVVSEPSAVTAEEWQLLGLAVVGLFAAAGAYIHRLNKGDVTVGGFKK